MPLNSTLIDTTNLPQHKKVFVCPLDWGLGHATRCIPLINALLQNQNEVVIGADGASLRLLQLEFPNLRFIPLNGYRIQYSKTAAGLGFKMAIQVPKLAYAIYREHQLLKQLQLKEQFDWVISDNRYGLWINSAYCVFITHQLQLKMPAGLGALEWFPRRIFRFFIHQYKQCWVPDYASEKNLSGALSHFNTIPKNTVYIGPLSRMHKLTLPNKNRFDWTVLLSGPEPQRTQLEDLILKQLSDPKFYTKKIAFVRGVTNTETVPVSNHPHLQVYNYKLGEALNELIQQSDLLICRSGYSTLMDLDALQAKALLIPTPGQTEQIYLAEYWSQRFGFRWMRQSEVDLTQLL